MLQTHLEFPCFGPTINHFSKEFWFIVGVLSNQDLGAGGAHCPWVALLPAVSAQLGNTGADSNPCIYVSIIISVSIPLYLLSINLMRLINILIIKKNTYKEKRANGKIKFLRKNSGGFGQLILTMQ